MLHIPILFNLLVIVLFVLLPFTTINIPILLNVLIIAFFVLLPFTTGGLNGWLSAISNVASSTSPLKQKISVTTKMLSFPIFSFLVMEIGISLTGNRDVLIFFSDPATDFITVSILMETAFAIFIMGMGPEMQSETKTRLLYA